MRRIWAWLSANYQAIGISIASLSLTVAAISAIASIWFNFGDKEYRLKRETLAFFLQYSPATRSRGVVSRDSRLIKYFDQESAIPPEIVNNIEDDNDGTNDAALRNELVDLVNYNEMLCLGRQKGILDRNLFDLQFKEILKADYRVLKNFLAFTVQKKDASYPFWAEALKEWGLESSDLQK